MIDSEDGWWLVMMLEMKTTMIYDAGDEDVAAVSCGKSATRK